MSLSGQWDAYRWYFNQQTNSRCAISDHKDCLLRAMRMVNLGKAWQKKVTGMTDKDLTRFVRWKAANNQQWAEALDYYTAMQVAAALEGKR